MGAITVSGLTRTAQKYQKELQMLPYAVMAEVLADHGVNLFPGVQYKDTIITLERKQGIARPYAVDAAISNATLGKMVEADLEVKKAYASIKDNIWNYKEKLMVTPDELVGKNTVKKHPFELQIMMNQIRTFSEDVMDSLFNGERNDSGTTPLDLYDGFETIVLAAITAGSITGGKGNYLETSTFAAPADNSDTNAIDYLVTWLRAANMFLKKDCMLLLPVQIHNYVVDALENKLKYKDVTVPVVEAYLKDKCNLRNFKYKPTDYMGTGDRLMLVKPGMLDFGMNSMSDAEFVQVRDAYEDPNYFQYWIQGDYGARIRSFNEKVFFTNDGSLTAAQLAGDYS